MARRSARGYSYAVSLFDEIGETPLVAIEGIFVKLECANASGSVKDRIAKHLVLGARRRGELREGDTIVEATSGNTGIALAMIGRALGHPVLVFMPEHLNAERRRLLEVLGAEVRLTPEEGGFEEPVRRRDELRGRAGHWIPDQFANPENPRCHAETTGRELVRQLRARGLGRLDAFVAGIGTGGTLVGVGATVRAEMPGTRLVAVEPEESAVLSGGEPGPHGIFGIGDGFVPPIVDPGAIAEVARVSTEEAHAEALRIRTEHGYCVGRSAGANHLAARRLHEQGLVVATIWPDSSNRYGSVGLPLPGDDVACPERPRCRMHERELLGEERLRDRGARSSSGS